MKELYERPEVTVIDIDMPSLIVGSEIVTGFSPEAAYNEAF